MNRLGILVAGLVAVGLLVANLASAGSSRAVTPVKFFRGSVTGAGFTTLNPTAIAYGPDGRLYVADWFGRVQALTLDPDTKAVLVVEEVASFDDLEEVFGIAFDPMDTSSPPPVYVTNSWSGFSGPPPVSYPGKITKIHGPGYANKTDIITGLPVGGGGHQSNGLAFTEDGTLYIAQGGTTNAGAPGGDHARDEVPLSGALLVAKPSEPGFDGNILYDPSDTYDTTVNQISGEVSVYATGLRNPYDVIIHSNGRIYATDNGPNFGDGAASTGCDSQGSDPQGPDELNLIEEGNYYGHPNRNRGRFDPRQCVYHSGTEGTGPDWTGPIALLPPSSDGLVEYTAATFGGEPQGDIFYVSWVNGWVGRIVLSPDGTMVESHEAFDGGYDHPLDITMGSDGTLYIAEFSLEFGSGNIAFLKPDEAGELLVDTDGDGCTDKSELSFNPGQGGQRDPLNFWDFYDVPDPNPPEGFPQRNGAINIDDIFWVAERFGTAGDPNGNPLSKPPKTGYHTAYDRGGQIGANAWNLAPANGSITIDDIFDVAAQFGHQCAGPP